MRDFSTCFVTTESSGSTYMTTVTERFWLATSARTGRSSSASEPEESSALDVVRDVGGRASLVRLSSPLDYRLGASLPDGWASSGEFALTVI